MSLKLNLHGAESFWEANSSPASKEISCILWNSEVHYHVHKSLKIVPVPIQMNAVYVLPSCFHKIPFNIILSSTPLSSKLLLFQKTNLYAYLTSTTHLTHLNLMIIIVFVEEWKSLSCLNFNIKKRKTLNKGTLNCVLVGLFYVNFGIWPVGLFKAEEPRKPYVHWLIIKCARLESSLRAWFVIHIEKCFQFHKSKALWGQIADVFSCYYLCSLLYTFHTLVFAYKELLR